MGPRVKLKSKKALFVLAIWSYGFQFPMAQILKQREAKFEKQNCHATGQRSDRMEFFLRFNYAPANSIWSYGFRFPMAQLLIKWEFSAGDNPFFLQIFFDRWCLRSREKGEYRDSATTENSHFINI